MSISGVTNTCQIIDNTQFYLSGLSETNLTTINILDDNGLDVSDCFGITTKIITVDGDNVTLTGTCNTSLEIKITEGIDKDVVCEYTGYTEQNSGLILVTYTGGATSLNVHPDCCVSLGFTSEIGADNYYVCRVRPELDPTDCTNYVPTGQFNGDDYMIFEYAGGGTTTIVPTVNCCYDIGLEDSIDGNGIHCIESIPFDPCGGLILVEPVADFGDIKFLNPTTNTETTLVPTIECCTSEGFNYRISGNKFICYKSTIQQPTISITNDECCLEIQVTTTN